MPKSGIRQANQLPWPLNRCDRFLLTVFVGILIYTVVFTLYTVQKYEFFRTGYFDLGIGLQEIWLASNGQFLSVTLGRPILAITALFFRAFPQPATVLAFESFMLGLGALPIFLIARRLLENQWQALCFSAIYLASPSLWGINAYEYHDLSMAVPFLLFVSLFYLEKRLIPFVASVVLALTTSSFVIIIMLFFALGIGIDSITKNVGKTRVYLISTFLCVVVWVVYLETTPFLPQVHLANTSNTAYTFLGSTAFLNPSAILGSPMGSLGQYWGQKLMYLSYIFGPFLILPFLSLRRLLPAFPWLAVVFFYSDAFAVNGAVGKVFIIWSQWSTFLLPFIFVGSIYGFRRLVGPHRRSPSRLRLSVLMAGLSMLLVVTTGVFSPLSAPVTLSTGDTTVPTSVTYGYGLHGIWPAPVNNTSLLNQILNNIPTNETVLTQNVLGSKLWERNTQVLVFGQPGYHNEDENIILVDYALPGACQSCVGVLNSTGNYKLVLSMPQDEIFEYQLVGHT